jgi:hypothetical protein
MLSNKHFFLTKRTKETIIATALVIIAIIAILYSTVIQPKLKQTLIQEKIDFLKSHGYNVFLTDVNYSALSRNSVKYNSFDEWYNELTILNTPHENWIGIAYINCYRTPNSATFWFQSITINGFTVEYTDYIVTI